MQAALATYLAKDRALTELMLPMDDPPMVLTWQQGQNKARATQQAQTLRSIAEAPDHDAAMAIVSRLAGFPLPVSIGAVFTTSEAVDPATSAPLPALEECVAFLPVMLSCCGTYFPLAPRCSHCELSD